MSHKMYLPSLSGASKSFSEYVKDEEADDDERLEDVDESDGPGGADEAEGAEDLEE
jgi:hypothetical protein